MSRYSVWVGGIEVNDHYLTYTEANEVFNEYIECGYDDVHIEQVG